MSRYLLFASVFFGTALRTSLSSDYPGVLYVKTYKTASSTLAGVLWRYGTEHNLTVWPGIFAHCNPQKIPSFDVVTGHNYCGRKGCTNSQKHGGVCRGLGYQPSWMEPKILLLGPAFIRVVMVAEPCERLVSSYFYRRAQARQSLQHLSSSNNKLVVATAAAGPGASSDLRTTMTTTTATSQGRFSEFDEVELVRYATFEFFANTTVVTTASAAAAKRTAAASAAAAAAAGAAKRPVPTQAAGAKSTLVDRDAVQWHFLADGTSDGTLGKVIRDVLPSFAVVGLTHRFDETLVLLRRALGDSAATATSHTNANAASSSSSSSSSSPLDFSSSMPSGSGGGGRSGSSAHGAAVGSERRREEGGWQLPIRSLLYARLKASGSSSSITTTTTTSNGGIGSPAASGFMAATHSPLPLVLPRRHPKFSDLSKSAQAAIKEAIAASGDFDFFHAAVGHFERSIQREEALDSEEKITSKGKSRKKGGVSSTSSSSSSSLRGPTFSDEAQTFVQLQGSLAEKCGAEGREEAAAGRSGSGGAPQNNRALSNPRYVLKDPRLQCMLRHFDANPRGAIEQAAELAAAASSAWLAVPTSSTKEAAAQQAKPLSHATTAVNVHVDTLVSAWL
jgi:hypothetical protein